MNITFEILQKACGFNGDNWKDGDNCNHSDFTYEGVLSEDGHLVRSDLECCEANCPFLK